MQRTHLSTVIALALPAWAASTASAQWRAPDVRAPWIGYPTTLYPIGLSTVDGVLADLDGDGHTDLATVSGAVNPRLSILLGDGLGTFAAPELIEMPVGAQAIAAADLDADGDQDLVVGNAGFSASPSVTVFLNLGGASFAAPTEWPIGGTPDGVAIADIDGNGALDIVAALPSAVGLVLGNGDGTFQPPGLFIVTGTARDLDVGDFDGDNDVDVVVAHSSPDQISVLENIGIGFAAPVTYPSIPTSAFDADANVHVADVDLDGDLDVALSSTGTGEALGGPGYGAIALYRGAGDGTFGAVETIPLDPLGPGAVDVAIADTNGDGWPDLIAATEDERWVLVANDGAGGWHPSETRRTGGGPVAVGVDDLDGDNDGDVVIVAGGALEACVHLNPGAADFLQPGLWEMIDGSAAPADTSALGAADIDADGDLDLIVGYSENWNGVNGISVRRNAGDWNFAPAELYPTPEFPEWLTVGDVDGDSAPDLVWLDGWGTFSARVRIKRNLGDGTFGTTEVLAGTYCEQNAVVALLDANGDSLPEIVVYECFGTLAVYPNLGGTFGARVTSNIGPSGGGALAGGDFDGDGFADLVTNTGVQGYVDVRIGNGNGTFQAPVTHPTGRGVEALAVADMNGDDELDIVAAYSLDGDGVSVLLGTAGASFAPSIDYPGTYSGATDNVSVGDLDGDGDLDVLVADRSALEVSVWTGSGDGTLAEQRRYGAGLPATSVVPGDFDADGLVDLATLVEPQGFAGWPYPAVTILPGLEDPWVDLGHGLPGSLGQPRLLGGGAAEPYQNVQLVLLEAIAASPAFLVAGTSQVDLPLFGGTLVPEPLVVIPSSTSDAADMMLSWPSTPVEGLELYFQWWAIDAAAPEGVAASNGVRAKQP